MPKYTPEEIKRADGTDISFVARLFEGHGYKVKKVRNYYLITDDVRRGGLALGLFSWGSKNFYDGTTQKGIISSVMKYLDVPFHKAVGMLLEGDFSPPCVEQLSPNVDEKDDIDLPKKISTLHNVYKYLEEKRGIDREVIDAFVRRGMIYEGVSNKSKYHNMCFIGKNNEGEIVFCMQRGFSDEYKFKGNAAYSDKRYPFRWLGCSKKLYVFESPIDMMAYISLMEDPDWINDSYIALCGVDTTGLDTLLSSRPDLKVIFSCLDNDEKGRAGNEAVKELVSKKHPDAIVTVSVPYTKDWDEDLQHIKGIAGPTHDELEQSDDDPEPERKPLKELMTDARSKAGISNTKTASHKITEAVIE